jgi:hypothetical protein
MLSDQTLTFGCGIQLSVLYTENYCVKLKVGKLLSALKRILCQAGVLDSQEQT